MWLRWQFDIIPQTPKVVLIASRLVLIIFSDLTLPVNLLDFDRSLFLAGRDQCGGKMSRPSRIRTILFESAALIEQSVKQMASVLHFSGSCGCKEGAKERIAPLFFFFFCCVVFFFFSLINYSLVDRLCQTQIWLGCSQPVCFALTQFQQHGLASKADWLVEEINLLQH